VNHGFARGLAGRFMGNETMKIGGVYMMLIEEYQGEFFW
jgi:hypothetical protein